MRRLGSTEAPGISSSRNVTWMFAFVASILLASCAGDLYFNEGQWRRQKRTMADMYAIGGGLEQYREEIGEELPSALRGLCEALELKGDLCGTDAWGHEFFYRVSVDRKSYVLVSFGRDGSPEGSEAEGEMFSKRGDYDADMVIVDGQWSRSPAGLCRPPIMDF